jgi:hypothetical protein
MRGPQIYGLKFHPKRGAQIFKTMISFFSGPKIGVIEAGAAVPELSAGAFYSY